MANSAISDDDEKIPLWCTGQGKAEKDYPDYQKDFMYFPGTANNDNPNTAREDAQNAARKHAIEYLNGSIVETDCKVVTSSSGGGSEGSKVEATVQCKGGYKSKGSVIGRMVVIDHMIKKNDGQLQACALLAVSKEKIEEMKNQKQNFAKCTSSFSNVDFQYQRIKRSLSENRISFSSVRVALQTLNSIRKDTEKCINLPLSRPATAEEEGFALSDLRTLERDIIGRIQIIDKGSPSNPEEMNRGLGKVDMTEWKKKGKPKIELNVSVEFTPLSDEGSIPLKGFPLTIFDDRGMGVTDPRQLYTRLGKIQTDKDGIIQYNISDELKDDSTFIGQNIINIIIGPHHTMVNAISDDLQKNVFKDLLIKIEIKPETICTDRCLEVCTSDWDWVQGSKDRRDFERFIDKCGQAEGLKIKAEAKLSSLISITEGHRWEQTDARIDIEKLNGENYNKLIKELNILIESFKTSTFQELAKTKKRQLEKLQEYNFDQKLYWNRIHPADHWPVSTRLKEYGDFFGNFSKSNEKQKAERELNKLAQTLTIKGLEETDAKMVWIPPGYFIRKENKVYIPNGFLMAEHETSVKEYEQYMEKTQKYDVKISLCDKPEYSNWKTDTKKPDYPANCISHADAEDFIKWLNKKNDSNSYRLCTDREWVHAALFGETYNEWTKKPLNELKFKVWYDVNGSSRRGTKAIIKTPFILYSNELGLFHMFGNVREWVEDTNTDENNQKCSLKLVGGSFMDAKRGIDPGNSYCPEVDERSARSGFRFCRSIY